MSEYINIQDQAVADYLVAQGVKTSAVLVQVDHTRDGWTCDKWAILINGEAFEYFTGTGHRIAPFTRQQHFAIKQRCKLANGTGRVTKELIRNPSKASNIYEQFSRAVPPTQACVLNNLLLDSDAADQSFADWCDEYSYDSDSKKDEKLYFSCQENSDKLHRVLTTSQLAHIATLLEDY